MEISPILLAKLLLFSFYLGGCTGVIYNVSRVVCAFLGVKESAEECGRLYSLKLPIIKSSVPFAFASGKGFFKFLRGVTVFFGDLLTVIFCALGITVLNYAYNDGRFRMFTVIGALVGFLTYYFTVGRLISFISDRVSFVAKYAFFSFFVLLGYPIKKILHFLIRFIIKMYFLLRFLLEKRRKKVYNIKEIDYLLKMSKNGFINR